MGTGEDGKLMVLNHRRKETQECESAFLSSAAAAMSTFKAATLLLLLGQSRV